MAASLSTGIAALAPPGTYLRIAPRSGLALKGIDVAAGVVDPDYRGEIKAILVNNGPRPFIIKQHMRVAQLILERINDNAMVKIVSKLPTTARGTGGFGHTDRAYISFDSDSRSAPSTAGPEAPPLPCEPPSH